MKTQTILIIEDERDMREAMTDVLRQNDFRVIAKTNGKEGLEAALTYHPDLILLDLLMPKMGGQETLKKLRQDPWGKQVPVIILSAMDDVANIGEGYAQHIVDYIIKSDVRLSDIVSKVKTALALQT